MYILRPKLFEVIGIPFEHGGQQFAVHRPAYHSPFNARYVVSHVDSGLAIGAVREYTIDDARAAAIAYLSANGAELQQALRRGVKDRLARATKVHGRLQ